MVPFDPFGPGGPGGPARCFPVFCMMLSWNTYMQSYHLKIRHISTRLLAMHLFDNIIPNYRCKSQFSQGIRSTCICSSIRKHSLENSSKYVTLTVNVFFFFFMLIGFLLGCFPFVRTDRQDPSLRNENFTINQNYPARSVKYWIECTKKMVFPRKLLKDHFIFKLTGPAMVRPASSDSSFHCHYRDCVLSSLFL